MKKNTRRDFLRSSSLVASFAAFSTPKLFKNKAILHLEVDSSESVISLIHSGGLNGIQQSQDQMGGLEAIQSELLGRSNTPVFLDSGNLINPLNSLADNLKYLKQLVNCGLHMATLGENERSQSPADLAMLVEQSGIRILGNSLEKNGLVLGKTYFTKAIIQCGKYKIGVLPTSNASLSEINRKAIELKLLHQCDLLIGLGTLPLQGDLSRLQQRHHEIHQYLINAEDQSAVGTRIFKSSQGMEFWVSKPGIMGKYIGAFEYTLNPSYQLRHFANHSFIPGEANWNKKMAFWSESSPSLNQQS